MIREPPSLADSSVLSAQVLVSYPDAPMPLLMGVQIGFVRVSLTDGWVRYVGWMNRRLFTIVVIAGRKRKFQIPELERFNLRSPLLLCNPKN